MKKSVLTSILPVLALLLAGCAGYHIGPVQPKFMSDIKTIAVPAFKNDTLTPRVEVLAADMIIRQIQSDGTYQVASSDKADATLDGTVVAVQRAPVRFLRQNVLSTTEFTLTVRLKFQITRRDTGEEIETRTVEGTSSYYVGSDTNEGERQALPLALQDAASRLVSQISEGW